MDSATLMERLMTVEKTVSPYCFRIASNISACNVVLLSYCVTSMPSRFSPLLIFLCITAIVSRMETRPYKEATSGCTGIIRSVAATSALTVISPTAGGQSRSTKSYPPSVLAASSLRKFSLPYSFCRRYSASAIFLHDGHRDIFSCNRIHGSRVSLPSTAPCKAEKTVSSGSVTPKAAVRVACGSKSARRTLYPFRASSNPTLVVVVVLPTPPF